MTRPKSERIHLQPRAQLAHLGRGGGGASGRGMPVLGVGSYAALLLRAGVVTAPAAPPGFSASSAVLSFLTAAAFIFLSSAPAKKPPPAVLRTPGVYRDGVVLPAPPTPPGSTEAS